MRPGDTLWQIARWHEVALEVVLRWNPATEPSGLMAGQEIIVPGGAPMPARARVQAPKPIAVPRPAPSQVPVTGHRWPLSVRGIITTTFSAAHPGIDIAAPAGTSVRAIAAATVVFAGWKNNGGGYVVVLRHPGGMISTYNHNQSLAVRAGQRVAAGQRIARVGSTGRSTGPHLDLRIEMGGRLVNPLALFEAGQAEAHVDLPIVASWTHLLATVLLVGYFAVMAVIVLPSLATLPAVDGMEIVATVQRRAMPVPGGMRVPARLRASGPP